MPVTNRTVTFQFEDVGGTPVPGVMVSFTPSAPLTVDGSIRVTRAPVTGTTGPDGKGAVSLIPTDSTAVTPAGFAYSVLVTLPGGQAGAPFSVPVVSGVVPLPLYSVVPIATPLLPSPSFLTLSLVGQPGGIASLDSTGLVPLAQLPPAATGAGGAVASVAGLTGAPTASQLKTALTLVKADVGLSLVDNTTDATKPVSAAQSAAIALAITNLVGAAPATRDTLVELSNILTADEAGATTLANLVGTKATTSALLLAAASDPDSMAIGALTYSSDRLWLLHSTGVQWPDGAAGVFDATLDAAAGAAIRVLGYTVTHVLAGVTLTFTQPAVTYASLSDTSPSARPAITVV